MVDKPRRCPPPLGAAQDRRREKGHFLLSLPYAMAVADNIGGDGHGIRGGTKKIKNKNFILKGKTVLHYFRSKTLRRGGPGASNFRGKPENCEGPGPPI